MTISFRRRCAAYPRCPGFAPFPRGGHVGQSRQHARLFRQALLPGRLRWLLGAADITQIVRRTERPTQFGLRTKTERDRAGECANRTLRVEHVGQRLTTTGADQNRRKVARHRSEEHTSELQSLMSISYAVF